MLCTFVEAPARLLQFIAISIELPVGITFWIAWVWLTKAPVDESSTRTLQESSH